MGILNEWRERKKQEERKIIEALEERINPLNSEQVKEICRHIFLTFGEGGVAIRLIKLLTERINAEFKINFVPKNQEEVSTWIDLLWSKTDEPLQKSILINGVFDVYRFNILNFSALMHRIEGLFSELNTLPEFKTIGGKHE